MFKPIDQYRRVPNSDVHNCFGCSSSNPHGLQMEIHTDDTSVFSFLTVPDHLGGYTDIVHGGVVATILDEIMGWAGIYLLKKITVTRTMSIEFLRPVHTGTPLEVKGDIIDRDDRNGVSVEGAIYDGRDRLCARSTGSFAVLSPRVAQRLGVMKEEEIHTFFGPMEAKGDVPGGR